MRSTRLVLSSLFASALARLDCVVKPLGGGRDDGPNILAAFERCKQNGKVVLDQYYLVNTMLLTPELDDVQVELSGILQYAPDVTGWTERALFLVYQNATTSFFLRGKDIVLSGGGTIDGNGQVWYDELAANSNTGVAGGSSRGFARFVPLTVGNATNVVVDGITMINAPFWNNFVYQSSNVTYKNIHITAHSFSSASASNTDGWDIYRSDHITIIDSVIDNDDDCVSLKPNSTNILVSNLLCSGSHGISVGSLGQFAGETDIVANVSVHNITMLNAQNGARVKVFGGSSDPNSISGGGSGFVKNITFTDFKVMNVDNPVLIDQCYSTPVEQCEQNPSTLIISDVHYVDITGTSSGSEGTTVVDLQCSAICEDITAVGTDIEPPDGNATYICKNIASLSELDFNCTSS